MKFEVEQKKETLILRVFHEGIDKGVVYNEFSRCRMGTCGHPTSEYSKVDEFYIEEEAPGVVRVEMIPYEGMHFNVPEFSECFESLVESVRKKTPPVE